jgi:RNA polymerase sigma-70 factor (ECF subfamily)
VLLRALEMIRGEFEPTSWTAFWRMAVEGHSASEIAGDLGWNGSDKADAARGAKRVRQAKLRIANRLREEFGEILDLP